MIATDKNGAPLSRGTRVMVRFEDMAPGLSWTGRVIGRSPVTGRTKVQSEFVTWKGPRHLLAEHMTRLADQTQPIEYHDATGYDVTRPWSPR